jgi:ubiquitin-like protein Pup
MTKIAGASARNVVRFGEDTKRSTGIPQPEVSHMTTKDTGGQKRADRQDEEVKEPEDQTTGDVQERHEKLTDDVDAILDEIDEVLEENAEEFVRSYVQKGGE